MNQSPSLPSCFFAAATIWLGSNPNLFCNSFSGAEAPNVFMPTTKPVEPTPEQLAMLAATAGPAEPLMSPALVMPIFAHADFTVPLTRGLVWLEDAHYNGDKFNTEVRYTIVVK